MIEGKTYNTARRYTPPAPPDLSGILRNPNLIWMTDADGLPALVRPEVAMARMPNQGLFGPDGSFMALGPWATPMGPSLAEQNAAAQALASQMIQNPAQVAQIVAATGGFSNTTGRPRGNGGIEVGRAIVETQKAAVAAQQQLENDVRSLEAYNNAVRNNNRRIVDVLNNAADQNLDPDADQCQRWAVDQLGMAFRSNPRQAETNVRRKCPPPLRSGAGRRVSDDRSRLHLADLPRRVLRQGDDRPYPGRTDSDRDHPDWRPCSAQDSKTGALKFEPVVTVFHNPPNATFKLDFDGGESIIATGIHRFWKAGQGWVMARDLKRGDVLRTIGGTSRVESVKADDIQPVFNLEVASGQSFFVGNSGLLVHDNSLVRPEPKPFDAAPSLTASK